MSAGTLPKDDDVTFTVVVEAVLPDRKTVVLRFNFKGEGPKVDIRYSGIGELSESQSQRLGNLTTNYVGNVAEILFHVN